MHTRGTVKARLWRVAPLTGRTQTTLGNIFRIEPEFRAGGERGAFISSPRFDVTRSQPRQTEYLTRSAVCELVWLRSTPPSFAASLNFAQPLKFKNQPHHNCSKTVS